MIDYQKDNKIKLFFIRILDFLLPKNKTVYASLYLDKDEEPKMVILQSSLDAIGKNGWILSTKIESNLLDKKFEYFIFYRNVGYFECKFFIKNSEINIKNYLNNLNNVVNALKAVNNKQKKDSIDTFKKNKDKNLKNIFGEEDN